jgi:hypothetical protein
MKSGIKIVLGLASVTALCMVTGVIPNPFNLNNDVPLHLQHEMKVSWHFEGKPQDIPILDQGTPFDDSKYFDLKPSIETNPLQANGIFKFNYEVEQFSKLGEYSGTFRYKVNSNDNSVYVHGIDITNNPVFLPLKNNPFLAKYSIDFLIRNGKGDWLVYLTSGEEGKVCIQAPTGMNFSQVITEAHLKNLEVLNSTKANSNYTFTNNNLEPYTGKFINEKGVEKTITLWFAEQEAQIPTAVPIMGLGVGIFKNVLEKKQQFLAVTEIDDNVLKLIDLQSVEEWGIDTNDYKTIKLDYHLPSGQNRINDIVTWLKDRQNEIALLREKRKQCPPNQAGSACRKEYERQIQEIQKEIESKAEELAGSIIMPVKD